MKVALVHSNPLPPTEGIGTHVLALARYLDEDGHDVHLFTRGGWTGSSDRVAGFPTHRPACPPVYPLHAHIHRLPLERSLERRGPFDVVHLHSPLVPLPSVDAATVATVHTPIGADVDSVPEDAPGQRLLGLQVPFSERVETSLVSGADVVTTVSGSMARLVRAEHERTVRVVHNGVDVSAFEPVIGDRAPDQLLYVGRLGRRKGLPRLLSVVERLRGRGIDCRLSIAGSGPLEGEVRASVTDRGLEDRVRILGFVDREDLLDHYRTATALVHLPEFEGLPTTVLEAMASGLPVVATDVPGCRDVVEDGTNGLLARKDDLDAIADAVVTLLEDEHRRRTLGRAGRATVEDDFDWAELSSEYQTVYREVDG